MIFPVKATLTNRFLDFSSRIQKVSIIRAIRNGLVSIIPVPIEEKEPSIKPLEA